MFPTQTPAAPPAPMTDVQGGSSSTADSPLMMLLKTLRDLLTTPEAQAAIGGAPDDGSMPGGLAAAVDPGQKDSKLDTREEGAGAGDAALADSDDMSSDGQDSAPADKNAGLKGAMSKLAAKRKPAPKGTD